MGRIPAVAAGLLLALGVGTAWGAQGREAGQVKQGPEGAMMQMMEEPNHKLVMGYKKHLMYFAEMLKAEVARTGKVEKEFAEEALDEMEHSVDKMKKYQDRARKKMSAEMRQQTEGHVANAEQRLAALERHVDRLEKEVEAKSPDPQKVISGADQVLKECEMMKMQMKEGRGR